MTATTPTPYNHTTPDWMPLERAVALAGIHPAQWHAVCAEFMWMYEEPLGVHHFKHRLTRRYLRLTIDTSAPACVRDLWEVRRG